MYLIGCAGTMSMAKLPERIIITDDPLRARVLVSHHLEFSRLLRENGDFFVFDGSYKSTPLSVVSTGYGKDNLPESLNLLKQLGAIKILYLSTCVSTTSRYDIKSLILGAGGSKKMTGLALDTAKQQEIAIYLETIGTQGVGFSSIDFSSDISSPYILNDVIAMLYDYASANDIEALALLTVSENTTTGAKMEENEAKSRLYPASALAFEIMAL